MAARFGVNARLTEQYLAELDFNANPCICLELTDFNIGQVILLLLFIQLFVLKHRKGIRKSVVFTYFFRSLLSII